MSGLQDDQRFAKSRSGVATNVRVQLEKTNYQPNLGKSTQNKSEPESTISSKV